MSGGGMAIAQARAERESYEKQWDSPALIASAEEAVILVHGTFAGRDVDRAGENQLGELVDDWWLPSSSFCKALEQRLPSHFKVAPMVFHWSGENSESARRAAGARLRDEIDAHLGQHGRKYHLVGHSHGGSVIAHALDGSIDDKRPSLRPFGGRPPESVVTVGTPFLAVEATWRHSLIGDILKLLGGVVLLSLLIRGVAHDVGASAWLPPQPWLLAIQLSCVAALVGLRIRRPPRQPPRARLPFAFARVNRLHLWSKRDEAIGALVAASLPAEPLTPKVRRLLVGCAVWIPVASALLLFAQLLFGQGAPSSAGREFPFETAAYLLVIGLLPIGMFPEAIGTPLRSLLLTGMGVARARATAFGLEAGQRVVTVSPEPDSDTILGDAPLSADAEEELLQHANARLLSSAASVREALVMHSAVTLETKLVSLGAGAAAEALIHTRYFLVSEVVERIADHIAGASRCH